MKTKIIITIFCLSFAAVSLSACGKIKEFTGLKDEPKNKRSVLHDGLKNDETILETPTHMEHVFGKDYQPWEPSEQDVRDTEEKIQKCFDDQANAYVNRVLGKKPEDYNKQFVGAINSQGERILWINCFCKREINSFKGWKENIIFVADGGNCFIQIKFNLDKNDGHYEFKVNGDA